MFKKLLFYYVIIEVTYRLSGRDLPSGLTTAAPYAPVEYGSVVMVTS